MNLKPIINSLLDTDLYKLTMLQVLLHQFPGAEGEYHFKCRNRLAKPLALFKDEIAAQVDHLCTLRFQKEELDYLRSMRFIKGDLVDYLDLFQFRRRFIHITTAPDEPLRLEIIAKGPLIQVMLFELFILAIVAEVFHSHFDQAACVQEGRLRLANKIEAVREFGRKPARRHPYIFFEFGTRRRASRIWQEEVVTTLARELPEYFRGTSNVDLARRYNLTPIGTMAHEYLQAHQAFGYRLRDFQKMALENWVREYRGDLGIALTDTVGMDAFLMDFDLYFAKLFDGLRHDSGDPFIWGEKALSHYEKLRIDPNTKMLTFSDSLDFQKTFDLYQTFGDRTRIGFGIGTHLTNDLGVEAPNIVMKIMACNGSPVAKISDAPGKTTFQDGTFMAYLRQVFGQ